MVRISRRPPVGWMLIVVLWGLSPWGLTNPGTAAELAGEFGLAGKFRHGRWSRLQLTGAALDSLVTAGESAILEVETLDGDAVRYRQRHPLTSLSKTGFMAYLPAGPAGAAVEVRLLPAATADAQDEPQELPLATWKTRLLEGAVDIDRTWVVAIGDSLGIEQIGASDLLGVAGSIEVSAITAANQLPDHWLGYDGVDFVVLSGSAVELLQALREPQRAALERWVRGGGRMLVSLGNRGPEMLAALPWLSRGSNATAPPRVISVEPNAVETYIIARDPLQTFTATQVSTKEDVMLLEGYSSERQSFPLIWRENLAFGVITLFAGGLESGPFRGWKQREEFLGKILPGLFPDRRQRGDGRGRSELRYRELAGQMRATLDRFPGAGKAQFSVLAAIILVLAGLIGPLDYWVVNRWLGRPLLGWVTFPFTVLVFSVGLILWRGAEVDSRVRQVTVIDMDSASGFGRGFTWGHVFSGTAQRLDLSTTIDPVFAGGSAQGAAATIGQWGYAGNVFGGIEVAGEDIRLPAYQMEVQSRDQQSYATELRDTPFAPQSSKSLSVRWQFVPPAASDPTLQRRMGSDLLTGSVVNPLGYDLTEGFLVYKNLVYQLPTRVPAGGSVEKVDALVAKNFRWRLNRRESTEESSESLPWNPSDDNQLQRLMELVLFYQAAGGAAYVNLDNRTLSGLDMSHLLGPDQALLVGKLRQPIAELRLQEQAVPPERIDHDTYVRIILPVGKSDLPMPKIPSPADRSR